MKLKYDFISLPNSNTSCESIIYNLEKYDTLHILSDDFIVLNAATNHEMIYVPVNARTVYMAIQRAMNEQAAMVYIRVAQQTPNTFVTAVHLTTDLLILNSQENEP